ncbi:MAG: hypothetical protein K8S23_00130 [Candidatus Cloacimonetes bacterium]|nr:hypothetical protein [Candidatus Cloacimonadota bacterium]
MKIFLLLILLLLTTVIFSLNIIQLEYFFDSDPGFGNGTNVPITSSDNITENFNLDMNGLTQGFYRLYIRTKNENDLWSITISKHVFKFDFTTELHDIIAMEYFFDTDPGVGNGTNVPITSGNQIIESSIADLSSVTDGFHTLYVRTQNEDNKWSITYHKFILKFENTPVHYNIVEIEYFFDIDPGLGNGASVSVTSGTDISKNFVADLSSLGEGFHTLYLRTKNENNVWSITQTKNIIKPPLQSDLSNIMAMEYYFDEDPGCGNGTNVPISSGDDITKSFIIDLDELEVGFHILNIRTKNENNIWSLTYTKPVYKREDEMVSANIVSIDWYFAGSDADNSQIYSYSDFTISENIEANIAVSIHHLTQNNNYNMHIYAVDGTGTHSIEYIYDFTANFVPDIQIAESNNVIELLWDEVYGANYYKIYDFEFPTGGFIEIDTTTQNNWSTPVTTDKRFYYVTAIKE